MGANHPNFTKSFFETFLDVVEAICFCPYLEKNADHTDKATHRSRSFHSRAAAAAALALPTGNISTKTNLVSNPHSNAKAAAAAARE